MKKLTVLISALIFFSFALTAQMNVSVSMTDDIYEFLDVAHKKGLCSPLNSYKPYTRSQILESLQEIYENSDKMSDSEIEMVEEYLALYEPSSKNDKSNVLEAHIANTNEAFPITFNYKSEFELRTEFDELNSLKNSDFEAFPRLLSHWARVRSLGSLTRTCPAPD